MIGKTILHYRIIEKLGEGGMGVVYKAEDTKLKRDVAIKFLPRQIAASDDERERFKIEARAAAALNHPNIATIHAIEEHDDEMFIVMEYIEGQELRDVIAEKSPEFSKLRGLLDTATQIAAGLQAAHKKGVTHRDIKSSNIMITETGQVKIMDFGLAKIGGGAQLTKSGMTMGTVAYMSPEQMQGMATDHRTDIWSFGVVLYEMLTGRLPFRGDYEQAVMYSIMNEDPESFADVRPEVPEALQTLVAKTMAKNRDMRYQDLQDMLVDLKVMARKVQTGTMQSISPGVRTGGSAVRRRSKFAWIGMVVAAILFLTLLYVLKPWKQASDALKSIAVLPLVNQSADPDIEYLSDGVTERLIDHLSPISGLKVLARSTVFHFKGTDLSPLQAGKELGVGAVLSGRLDQRQDHLIVGVELVDVATGAQLWGERFNRKMSDIFEIEEEISRNISEKLKLRLGLDEQEKLSKRATENSGAYQLYLKGRYYWNKRSTEAMPQALSSFQRAVQLDPNFALAWSGIADCYTVSFGIYLGVSSTEAFANAKSAVQTALKIDESLAEAHASLGVIEDGEWHWQAAQSAFEHALELNPGYASAHQWYGEHLYITGRYDESVAQLQQALELDPLSLIINSALGWSYLAARDVDKAIAQSQRTLDMEPDFFDAQDCLAQAMMLAGRSDIEVFREIIKRDSLWGILSAKDIQICRTAFKQEGMRGYWRSKLTLISEQSGSVANWPFLLAECYAQLGLPEKAMPYLEAMFKQRDPILSYIRILIFIDPLRSEPRFQEIVRQMNFPDQ